MVSSDRQKHWMIAADLRASIEAGDLLPGDKLPSISQLTQRYSVFNQTVQNAIGLLRDEGLVESEKGRGTFVLPALRQAIFPAAYLDPVEAGEQYPWMTEAARREQRGSSRLLDVAEVDAPAQVAAALDLKEQERPKVVRRVLMMLINDSPAELVNLYYPIDLARGTPLVESKRIKGGTPRVLTDMGYAPVAVVDEVSARASTSEEYELLNLSAEVPVLRTFRVAYTAERRPVEVSVLVKASNLYTLVYEVKCHHCSERTEE